jgi:hypothetical protein
MVGDEPEHQRDFLSALQAAAWPAVLWPINASIVHDDPDDSIITAYLDVQSVDGELRVGSLCADYDGRRLWLGWGIPGSGARARREAAEPVGEFDPAAAADAAFEYFISQLEREVVHLLWVDDHGSVVRTECRDADTGNGRWWRAAPDYRERPDRSHDREIRFRPLPTPD